ncbi:MAG: hypothetical protein CR988_02930 [Treponema sp.]|nr:MAG: hypothetical protein CR988_02930 [Treponema sp.]
MLKIINDFQIMEMMIFFWESVADKEKVPDSYFINIAEKPEMSVLYNDEFTQESVRKVMSAITNRERLNNRTKLESKFWNNNMRMLEDRGMTEALIAPAKVVNFTELEKKYPDLNKEINLIFIPGCAEEHYIKNNTIYMNFFKLINDFENPECVKIDGKPFKERITEIIETIL